MPLKRNKEKFFKSSKDEKKEFRKLERKRRGKM